MEEPKVSVVIPTFNRANELGRAIASVLAQSFQDFELIIVDDASSDATPAIIASIDDPRVRFIQHEVNQGGSAARNTGIKASLGEYIAFLDSDDEWLPNKLQLQVDKFACSPSDVGVVYTGREVVCDGETVKVLFAQQEGDLRKKLLQGNCVGTTSSVMVKQTSLIQSGLFDERLPAAQDLDLWIRLSRICKFRELPAPLVRFHLDADGRITNNIESRLKAWLYLDDKNRDEFSTLTFQRKRAHKWALAGYQWYLSGWQ